MGWWVISKTSFDKLLRLTRHQAESAPRECVCVCGKGQSLYAVEIATKAGYDVSCQVRHVRLRKA